MKTAWLAALAVLGALSSPVIAMAQGHAPTRASPPTERNGLNEQLRRLNVTIDRRLAHGRISKDDAVAAHREVNDIQAEATADRLRDGGQVSERDHFTLQDRINKLREKIDSERMGAPR